jgi:hypothetical protein
MTFLSRLVERSTKRGMRLVNGTLTMQERVCYLPYASNSTGETLLLCRCPANDSLCDERCARLRWRIYFPRSKLMDGLAARHGPNDCNILDLIRVDGVRIGGEDDEIGELSCGDGTLDAFLVGLSTTRSGSIAVLNCAKARPSGHSAPIRPATPALARPMNSRRPKRCCVISELPWTLLRSHRRFGQMQD